MEQGGHKEGKHNSDPPAPTGRGRYKGNPARTMAFFSPSLLLTSKGAMYKENAGQGLCRAKPEQR